MKPHSLGEHLRLARTEAMVMGYYNSPKTKAESEAWFAIALTLRNPGSSPPILSRVCHAKGQGCRAFSQIAGKWVRRDPVAAAAWLETLSAGAERDAAAGSFAGAVQRADPETAVAWASILRDAREAADASRGDRT